MYFFSNYLIKYILPSWRLGKIWAFSLVVVVFVFLVDGVLLGVLVEALLDLEFFCVVNFEVDGVVEDDEVEDEVVEVEVVAEVVVAVEVFNGFKPKSANCSGVKAFISEV